MALTPQAFCLYTQEAIGSVMATDPTQKLLQPTGLLTALKSTANAQGSELLQVTDAGKFKRLDIKYFPANCRETTTGAPNVCTPTDVSTYDAGFITLNATLENDYVFDKVTFSPEEFRSICESKSDRIARKIQEMARNVLQKERAYYTAGMYALLNDYFDGTDSLPGGTEKTLNLFNAQSVRQGMGLFKLIKEYQMKGYTERPIIVGGSTISAWVYANGIFGANTDGAADGGGVDAYIDLYTAQYGSGVAGDANERVLSWVPGHNQAITWLLNEGEFRYAKPTLAKTTIVVDGETFDYSVSEPDCGNVTLTLGKGLKLFNVGSIPNGSCDAQPSTLNWIADCGNLTCDVVKQPIANS
jgi:hypothetical protein